jgi:hypothetical protein
MKFAISIGGALVAMLLALSPARSQEAAQPASKQENDLLKRELDLLKREMELLKKENELLKQEIATLKKEGAKSGSSSGGSESTLTVTKDNIEYTYKGITRSGQDAYVHLLVTSKDGDRPAPFGQMTLIDGEGNKYIGMPPPGMGFNLAQNLKEGIPVIDTFVGLTVDKDLISGKSAVDFRNVPATLPTPKKK